MHKKRVVHGDLKLNNILVGADGQAKLSDFGLSSVSGSAAASEAAIAGGLRWRAPEYLTHAPTFASDVYSFAMCMIEAEIGNPPFAFLDDDGVRENLRDGTIPDKPDTMSSDEWDLVVSMTNVYPAKRISLLSVLEKLKRFAKQEATANPDGAPKQTFAATQSLTSAEVVQSSVVGASNRIAELLDKIAVARDDDIKQSLLKLVRECLNDDHRTLLYEADGIQILSNVLSVSEFNALRNCVEAVPKSDVVSLLNALQKGTDYEKEQALIRCVCITSRGIGGKPLGTKPVSTLLRSGSDTQKLWVQVAQALVVLVKDRDLKHNFWAAEALGNLAADNEAIRSKIARKESITALVTLIQVGNDEHKHRAAYALGEIALSKAASEMIVQNGAIPSLVGLVRVGTEQQKKTAMSLLGILLRTSYTNRAEIEREKSVAPLIALTLLGSDDQKSSAAIALQRFSSNTTVCDEIAREGGIVPLIALLQSGSDQQNEAAAGALMNLANDSETSRAEIGRKNGLVPLIRLLGTGSGGQKTNAAGALRYLALSDEIRAEICQGGVAIVIKLLREGTEELKVTAAGALKNIANNDAICGEISREGGAGLLTALLGGGTDEQKAIAAGALARLAWNNEGVRLEVQRDGAIAPLLDFIKSGTHKQKTNAADALRSLAKSDVIRAEICHYRGAERMLKLLKTGLDEQKAAAAGALESFAWNEEMNSSIVCEGGIPPLVQLLRSGNQVQKTNAAGALASILRHNGNAPGFFESGDQGAISSLIALLETGTDEQKNSAAVAVGCLTTTWDNCADIERRGGVDLLIVLSKTGTQEQKRSALNALDGTDEEKEMAAKGLEIMARTSSFTAITIVKQGGVASLVKLLRDGTDRQK
ncbi:hypothetical protein PC113_g2808 [Phytophthora cactorum]|uniref:Protein kinase domain-containing protein n=1 Tax=Phytophthora cactorum TaxID=29920 RepID=A0A8T0ZWH4_9STRA|nr:hypothetical protein PC113_g2808 [Phytophthora cactorum]